jgi:lipopolysaccharide/colanic/teichoic acid biosynthesis glycosyltransferase
MSVHFPDLIDKVQVVSNRGRAASSVSHNGFYRSTAKRLIDIAMVLLMLPIVLPIIVVLACLVARDGHRPFYIQKRVGMGGRVFTMWKLRSMVPDAERRLAEYLASNPNAELEWASSQKLKHDPRITKLGRILRKASLDELPQLWNVLKGEMSLVGPRPMMPEQQALYPGQAYYNLRPGITGTWQISDRNQSSFAARAEFDNAYDKSLSMTLDVMILFGTVRVVVNCTGY